MLKSAHSARVSVMKPSSASKKTPRQILFENESQLFSTQTLILCIVLLFLSLLVINLFSMYCINWYTLRLIPHILSVFLDIDKTWQAFVNNTINTVQLGSFN